MKCHRRAYYCVVWMPVTPQLQAHTYLWQQAVGLGSRRCLCCAVNICVLWFVLPSAATGLEKLHPVTGGKAHARLALYHKAAVPGQGKMIQRLRILLEVVLEAKVSYRKEKDERERDRDRDPWHLFLTTGSQRLANSWSPFLSPAKLSYFAAQWLLWGQDGCFLSVASHLHSKQLAIQATDMTLQTKYQPWQETGRQALQVGRPALPVGVLLLE